MGKKSKKPRMKKKRTPSNRNRTNKKGHLQSRSSSLKQIMHDALLDPEVRKNALYECCKCSYHYYFYPGAAGPPSYIWNVEERVWQEIREPNVCPVCGHLYVKWLNYKSDFAPHAYIVAKEER